MEILGIGLVLLCLLLIAVIIKASREEETRLEIYPEDVEIIYQSNGKFIVKTGTVMKR